MGVGAGDQKGGMASLGDLQVPDPPTIHAPANLFNPRAGLHLTVVVPKDSGMEHWGAGPGAFSALHMLLHTCSTQGHVTVDGKPQQLVGGGWAQPLTFGLLPSSSWSSFRVSGGTQMSTRDFPSPGPFFRPRKTGLGKSPRGK